MRMRSLYEICSHATAIILALVLVNACATAPIDPQSGDTVDVTTLDKTKPAIDTNKENEKYDAITSATPRESDDSKAIGDSNGAPVDWILLVVLGLIATARRQRSGNLTKSLKMNASGACQPVFDHEFR